MHTGEQALDALAACCSAVLPPRVCACRTGTGYQRPQEGAQEAGPEWPARGAEPEKRGEILVISHS
jgi:hypothetical protein